MACLIRVLILFACRFREGSEGVVAPGTWMGASEAVGAGTLVLGVPDASTWSTRAGAGASGAEVEVGAGASWAGAPRASVAGVMYSYHPYF